jgi:hypothetical protein
MTQEDINKAVKILRESGHPELAKEVECLHESEKELEFNWHRETWRAEHYKKLYDDALYFEANAQAEQKQHNRAV